MSVITVEIWDFLLYVLSTREFKMLAMAVSVYKEKAMNSPTYDVYIRVPGKL